MNRVQSGSAGHCPDCGRPVEPEASLCACGFPLMFLRQEEPEAAVLKPSRRPAEDSDDTDVLPVFEPPPRAVAPPPAPSVPVASAPADGLVCAGCDEVNPISRTWCAHCGAALRERRDLTEVLPTPLAPRPRSRALLVGGVIAAMLVVGGGAALAAASWRDEDKEGGTEEPHTDAGALTVTEVVASATGRPSKDDSGQPVPFVDDNVVDGNPTTAWRVEGAGKQVRLVLTLDGERAVTRVGLIPGYAKTDSKSHADRFEENGRVTGVSWEFDGGLSRSHVIARPTREWAWLPLDEPVRTKTVTLVLEESQPGTREGRTTAISEVAVIGR